MKSIKRVRYVVIRDEDEIFCGLARNYMFKKIDDIGNTSVKTYLSEDKAKSSVDSSWGWKDNMRVVKVIESIKEYND